ncbi:MAG: hypothetical protein KJ668_08210, partial [Proteobacteria bacterium]|nr:hypothetical protein [Pseudomonadota bacterium]
AMTAAAAEWNFYGNARVDMFVTDVDNPGATTDDKDFAQSFMGTSRIGANIKVSDELTARFEVGGSNNRRLLYGTWNFGSGTLAVGQMWTPLNWYMSSQVYGGDNGLAGWGAINALRSGAVQLGFGGFKIALVAPTQDAANGTAAYDVNMPTIEADFVYNFDNGFVKVAGGYNAYEVTAATYTADIEAYALGLNGGINFGAFGLKAGVWVGQNVGVYNSNASLLMINTDKGSTNDGEPTINLTTGQVTDNDAYGFVIVGTFTVNDTLAFEAGYGYAETELDAAGSFADDVASYYLQATITFAPGVFIVPEIGVIDYGKDAANADEEEDLYYGLKWQINF